MRNDERTPRREKPEYSMFRNALHMLSLAARENPVVLWLMATIFVTDLGYAVSSLYLPKVVIAGIERRESASYIVLAVLLFTVVISLLKATHTAADGRYQIEVIACRTVLLNRDTTKTLTTSYSNTDEPDFRLKCEKAREATSSNSRGTESGYRTITGIVTSFAGFIVYFALLTRVNLLVLLGVSLTTVVSFLVRKGINEWEYTNEKEAKDNQRKLWYVIGKGQDHQAAKDIRIFGIGRWLRDLSDDFQKLCFDWERRRNVRHLLGDVLGCLMSLLREGLAYGFLLHFAVRDGMAASDFVLYFAAITGFSNYLSGILSQVERLHGQMLDVDRVRVFLEYPEVFNFNKGRPLPFPVDRTYELELRNVSYRYPAAESDAIKSLSLVLRAGEKLAVVGLNGAGKTTLVKLLCGLYDPSEGQVLLNGVDVRDLDRNEYYELFAAVFQEHSLLPLSIAGNIALSTNVVDEKRVRECLGLANLEEKIDSLPDGFHSLLLKDVHENAVELSGGETQRLLLARALYKEAPVVVLDEPTAALDPIAERELYLSYNALIGGRTSVFISHRLASTRFCDRIIVIEKGEIAETGSHDELMRAQGRYASLFDLQSQYYRETVAGGETHAHE